MGADKQFNRFWIPQPCKVVILPKFTGTLLVGTVYVLRSTDIVALSIVYIVHLEPITMASHDASKSHLVCCKESLLKLLLLPENIWQYFCTQCWVGPCVHANFWHLELTHWHDVTSFLCDKLCLDVFFCFSSQEIMAFNSTVWVVLAVCSCTQRKSDR